MNVVGYVRVSTDDQALNGAGLEAQRQAIVSECERRGWTLTGIEEDALSGKTVNRPGLQRALARCRPGARASGLDSAADQAAHPLPSAFGLPRADGLIVAKLDRLSRSVIDFANLLADAQKRGYNVVALDIGLDLSTPHGEFFATVLSGMAQWERRIIGQRTADALAVKRAQGVQLGRPPSIPPDLAQRIRELRQRQSLRAICRTLNRERVPTPRGGKMWRPSSLRAVV